MIRQTIIVVLFVCLVSTSSVLAGTWRDDFEKGFVDWKGLDDCWVVEDGECSGEYWNAPADMELIWTGDTGWKDYTVKCKMKFAVDPSGQAGISFRDTGEFWGRYGFVINADANTAAAMKGFQGVASEPSKIPLPFNLSKDTWYELKVIAKGDNFEFYIDEKPAGEFKDNSIPFGKVGFCVKNAHAHFDDLIISGDDVEDGGNWDVKPKGKLAIMWGEIKSNQP